MADWPQIGVAGAGCSARKTHNSLCHLREASAVSAGSALASISMWLLPNSSIANHSTAGSWPYKWPAFSFVHLYVAVAAAAIDVAAAASVARVGVLLWQKSRSRWGQPCKSRVVIVNCRRVYVFGNANHQLELTLNHWRRGLPPPLSLGGLLAWGLFFSLEDNRWNWIGKTARQRSLGAGWSWLSIWPQLVVCLSASQLFIVDLVRDAWLWTFPQFCREIFFSLLSFIVDNGTCSCISLGMMCFCLRLRTPTLAVYVCIFHFPAPTSSLILLLFHILGMQILVSLVSRAKKGR